MKKHIIATFIILGYAWLAAGFVLDGYLFYEYVFGDSQQLSDPIRHWPYLLEIQLLLVIPMLAGVMIGATIALAIVLAVILVCVKIFSLIFSKQA